MAAENIKCPQCGIEIEVAEVLRQQVAEELTAKADAELNAGRIEIATARKKLELQQVALTTQKETLDRQVKEKLQEREAELRKKMKVELDEVNAAEMADLRSALESKDEAVKKMQAQELALRKEARQLEESKASLELDIARKMDQEREKIRRQAVDQYAEQHALKEKEKDRLIQQLKESLEDAKRKAEQGSVEAQGETLEDDLEEWLKSNFPYDEIEPVKKGVQGADVKQHVKDSTGKPVGTILWESKNARNWSASWVQKLKDDQRNAGADIGMLITAALPPDIKQFGPKDGIWITGYPIPVGVVRLMRESIMRVAYERQASVGKDEKMEALYAYLTGPEFRQKVETIVETFAAMKTQLESEKRSMTRIWNAREQQIGRVLDSTIGMHGQMEGLIGGAMPTIAALELPGGTDDSDTGQANE
ncbi:MAG: DUF2130 domain-containing protein [Verrucomicrobia bacterium]|jgi:hypothetical protein|nr:DUF2130 domain-containing protein [Verrucomicrobiota bacterium]